MNDLASKDLNYCERYLVDWYIGVAKKRGWDEVVRLLVQEKDQERMKMLIKKRLGK